MDAFERLSNGYKVASQSLTVIRQNKHLLIFPILSAATMAFILSTFVYSIYGNDYEAAFRLMDKQNTFRYVFLFGYYLVSYFVVVFFNMALVHCARIYFQGGKPTVSDGLRFSIDKIGTILSWAILAATFGLIIRIIQDNVGFLGKIITGLVGVVWSIATFFIVPVLAYENLRPMDALRRSGQIMKEKWGESLGMGFNVLGILCIGFVLVALPLFLLGSLISFPVSIILGIIGVMFVSSFITSLQNIFISAIYLKINDTQVEGFNDELIDSMFYQKKK